MAEIVEIIENKHLGANYHRLLVLSDTLQTAAPGQFAHLLVQASTEPKQWDPLLRRPLSIYDLDGKHASFLYKVVGRGTKMLSHRRRGETLDLLGPLGTGFQLPKGPAILIGGGVGAAPLLFLARKLKEEAGDFQVLLGAQRGEELAFAQDFRTHSSKLHLTTADGTVGSKGLVTDLLPRILQSYPVAPKLFACGPLPMLKALSKIAAEQNLSLDVSLEAQMACGIGACYACTCYLKDGSNARVCAEGPVLPYQKLDWSELGG